MIDAALATAIHSGRIVWTGRLTSVTPAVDSWTTDRRSLLRSLEAASELVVLDALSFPWELWEGPLRDIPLVVALPLDLDAASINAVLGACLLAHLSPFDVLVDPRAGVREQLTKRWQLTDDNWLDCTPGGIESVIGAIEARADEALVHVDTEIGRFRAPSDDLVTDHLREHGAHQRGTLNVLRALTLDTDLFVDVGAHIGTMTVPMAQRLSSGRVVAVEGDPATARLLAQNVEANGLQDRVVVHQAVLGATSGHATAAHRSGNSGATSFVSRRDDVVGAQHVRRLDDLVADLDVSPDGCLLKVDVEGSELSVLQGGEHFVSAARPAILVEVASAQLAAHGASVPALDRWLRLRDYDFFLVDGPRNFVGSSWSLRPIADLGRSQEPLYDVLAVPRGSERWTRIPLKEASDA